MIDRQLAIVTIGLLAACGEASLEDASCEEALLHAAACEGAEFDLATCDPKRAESVLSASCEELAAEAAADKADGFGNAPRLTLGSPRSSESQALADVAAHVAADPSNVAEAGEYCGLVVRTWNGKYLAIRHGANTTGTCGVGDRDYSDFVRFGESIQAQWHSHPLHADGAANFNGPGAVPPGGMDALSLVEAYQYHGVRRAYVVSNHDPRVIYRYGFVSVPVYGVELMLQRGIHTAIDATANHWRSKGHSSHSAWITAQHEFTYPSSQRSLSNEAAADIGTGIRVEVSYDRGVSFR